MRVMLTVTAVKFLLIICITNKKCETFHIINQSRNGNNLAFCLELVALSIEINNIS